MATKESVMASKSGLAIASAQAGQTVTVRGTYDLTDADTIDTTLQLRMVKLPAQHRIVRVILDNDDLDSSTAAAIDIGLEDDIQDPSDTTNLLLIATTIDVQTAANAQEFVSHASIVEPALDYDRYIVVTWETVAGTAKGGRLGITLVSRPELGSQFDGNA